jgi:hypothetical protein
MTPQQQENWQSIERHYRFMIPVWFLTSVASVCLAIYIGPSWEAMVVTFLGGFQLAAGISCIEHRKTARYMRASLIGFESTIEQWEKLRERDDRTPLQPS